MTSARETREKKAKTVSNPPKRVQVVLCHRNKKNGKKQKKERKNGRKEKRWKK